MAPGPKVVPDKLAIWNERPSRELATMARLVTPDSVMLHPTSNSP